MEKIRRLTAGDEADAATLTRLFGDPGRGPGDPGAWLVKREHVMLGAWVGDEPAGMAYGYRLARPDGGAPMLQLYSIDVDERFRGHGIGTRLTRAFAAQAPSGAWVITNASNEPAMRMYRAAGATRPFQDDVMFRLPSAP